MGLDQLLELLSSVSTSVLPILGVVALIFLIIFLRRMANVMKTANDAVVSLKDTLDTTTRQLDTLDKPLQTLNELSETVDNVHEATKHAAKSIIVALIENFSSIKDWAFSMKAEKEETAASDNGSDSDERNAE